MLQAGPTNDKIFEWSKSQDSVVANSCVKMTPQAPLTLQLNQAQIITLQFADWNRNDNFFLARQCIYIKKMVNQDT